MHLCRCVAIKLVGIVWPTFGIHYSEAGEPAGSVVIRDEPCRSITVIEYFQVS